MYIVYSLVTGRLGGEVSCSSSPGAGVDILVDVPENAPEGSESAAPTSHSA